MASRHRELTAPSTTTTDENAHARVQMKNAVATKPLFKRPALGEISKNITGQTTRVVKTETLKLKTFKPAVHVEKKVTATKPPLLKQQTLPAVFHGQKKTTKSLIKQLSTVESKITSNTSSKSTDTTSKSITKTDTTKPVESTRTSDSKLEDLIVDTRPDEIEDPDADSRNDPELVTEYILDICQYMRELEVKYSVDENFLKGHKSTPKMRGVLVNWLAQVAYNFKFCLETLHISVSLLDRYLQNHKEVGKETLQLVGVTALLIACKFEEVYLPVLDDFVYVTDNAFTNREVLQMEMNMLAALDFNLGKPVSIQFLRRYSKVGKVHSEQHILGKYLLELALLEHTLSHVRPSLLAAAASCLAISILDEVSCPSKVWTPTLVYYSTYKYLDIKNIIIQLAQILSKADISKFQAIQTRYNSANCCKTSTNPKLKGSLVRKLMSTSTFK